MLGSIVQIQPEEFNEIAQLVYSRFGIHLTDKKMSLVQGRLNKVLRRDGFSSFRDYFSRLKADTSGTMLTELINQLSTNHTFFFREAVHFELLRQGILEDVSRRFLSGRGEDLRLWCAGCATGEEAYTLAMVIRESFPALAKKPLHPLILATDISIQALGTAYAGVYEASRLKGIDPALVKKYFIAQPDGRYRVSPLLKDLILFKRLNFMDERFPFRKSFHIIFCRNVMIYFDQPTKDSLVRKFAALLAERGYLFIGHSESISRSSPDFEFIAPAAYRKRG